MGAPVFQVVDIFSKQIYAAVLPSRKTDDLLPAVEKAFVALGKPMVMQSDNAKEFVHGLDRQLKALQIEARHSRPYHPQTQGVAERTNGDVKKAFVRELLEARKKRTDPFLLEELNGTIFLVNISDHYLQSN